MPISSRVLQKAVDMGLTKGGQFAALKTQVIKAAPTRQQGVKDFTTVKRSVLRPATAVTSGSFKKAFEILDEAGAVKGRYQNSSGANLLKKAAFAVKKEEEIFREEKKQENLRRSLSTRVRDEWEKSGKIENLTQRDVVDSILGERKKADEVFKVLEQARSGDSDQSPGPANALTMGQRRTEAKPETPAPPLDLQIG